MIALWIIVLLLVIIIGYVMYHRQNIMKRQQIWTQPIIIEPTVQYRNPFWYGWRNRGFDVPHAGQYFAGRDSRHRRITHRR